MFDRRGGAAEMAGRLAAVAVAILGTACGGGDGPPGDPPIDADTSPQADVLDLEGGLATQYTEAVLAEALHGHDPEIFAQQESTIEGIEFGMWSGWTGSGAADGFGEYLFVNFKRSTVAGSFQVDGDGLSALYRTDTELFFGSASVSGAAGTAELTGVGAQGELARGSFDITLCQSPDGSSFPSNCDLGSRTFRGTFTATVEAPGSSGRGLD